MYAQALLGTGTRVEGDRRSNLRNQKSIEALYRKAPLGGTIGLTTRVL